MIVDGPITLLYNKESISGRLPNGYSIGPSSSPEGIAAGSGGTKQAAGPVAQKKKKKNKGEAEDVDAKS